MPFQEQDFRALFERLSAIDLFGAAPPDVPYPLPPQEAPVRQAIQSGEHKLPVAFQQGYSEPLLARLKTVMARLEGSPDIIETLAGSVYQHVDTTVAGDLGRFLAVISDLYRSFLSKKRRMQADFPLVETLPPLAMFQHQGDAGPFTIPCDDVQQLAAATVGVVSLPATYRDHPLLWASLGHETGGHDVLHADRELLPELEAGVESFFGSAHGRTSGRISDERLMGAIWSYWMDEAASDVYGALNIGPAFGHNLVAFFAALNAQGGNAHNGPSLRTVSGFDPRDPAQALDPHPTDILRPFLLIGAVQNLHSLSEQSRSAYVQDLQRLAAICAPQAKTVRLAGMIRLGPGRKIPVDRSFPIEVMQLAAVQVGGFIANARLNALNGRSIQEIETWDDADEAAAKARTGDACRSASEEHVAHKLAGQTVPVDEAFDHEADDGAVTGSALYVDGADEIEVALNDGRKSKARVVGTDPESDLAVLRIPAPEKLPVITFAGGPLRVGDVVLAIGNPFGVGQTVTSGIVSALGRSHLGINTFENFIQTDAAINPGNSGGPLLDSAGRLIGVNSAIRSSSGSSAGVGFAIPVDLVNRVVPQLIATGRAARPGIGIEPADPFRVARAGITGVVILRVTRGGPAAEAGLRPYDARSGDLGDVIIAVNGRPVATLSTFVAELDRVGIANTAELTVNRAGSERKVRVRVVDVLSGART